MVKSRPLVLALVFLTARLALVSQDSSEKNIEEKYHIKVIKKSIKNNKRYIFNPFSKKWVYTGYLVIYGKMIMERQREVMMLTQLVIPQERAIGKIVFRKQRIKTSIFDFL